MEAADGVTLALLAGEFPGWHIWRSRDARGREGDWNATRRRMRRPASEGIAVRLSAADAAGLRELLGQQQAAELALSA